MNYAVGVKLIVRSYNTVGTQHFLPSEAACASHSVTQLISHTLQA